ncbi:MAG TPA: F0F1 ATP synthase subunit A [Pontiellaceae bacterium]|nr:F0F1 ATP synthase subunit A [Pontiellaceae bacterium]HPR82884.1 F0F1 ATP synthase subunit A [Pontiellaceae bacterium]
MQTHALIRPFVRGFKPAGLRLCVLFVIFLFGFTGLSSAETSGSGAEAVAGQSVSAEVPAGEEGGEHLSVKALEIFSVAGVPVTNSMITGWLAAFILIAVSVRFRRQVQAGRHTMFTGTVEALVIFLHSFLSDIMGEKLAKKTFWLLGSFFIFILCSNWLGLFPGIGSIGWGHKTDTMFKVTQPLFRGVNADLNTTMALGALFFLFWFIWAWKENGPLGILKHIFAPKGGSTGIMHFVMAVVFLAVGVLEILSIIVRPFSLALRLYGNIFAGEVMLETMLHKIPALGWLLPVPFYLMEVLVGFIQSLVFMLLSAVFIMLICGHEGAEEHPEQESAPDVQQH